MKRLLLCSIFCFSMSFVFAQIDYQVESSTTNEQDIDNIFQNLDKSAVTTGVLYDRSVAVTMLYRFNELNADTSYYDLHLQAYSELYHATYSNSALLSPTNYNRVAEYRYKNGLVPMGVTNYQYNVLDTNSTQDNLIYESGGFLYDVPGRSRPPWWLRQTTMVSPLVTETDQETVNYFFGPEFWLENGSRTITSLQVDFGDGSGYQSVTKGSTVTVYYSSSGPKYIKSLVTYSDAGTLTTYSAIQVNGSSSSLLMNGPISPMGGCSMRDQLPQIITTETFQGYTETSARPGVGDVTVFYHTNAGCDEVIRKPIIVIDGFDPGNVRTALDPEPSKNIYAQLQYNNGNSNLGDDLRAQGYDIIILDFPKYIIGTETLPFPWNYITIDYYLDGGADYIERNALVLKQLIRNINLHLQQISSTEQIVVVGPSMGGLIARYALAKMEQASEAHNTRMFVSFDAPHLGANIPLGDQLYINFYANRDIETARISRDDKLASTAAKQMLRLHYLSQTGFPPSLDFGAPNFRNTFQTELDNTGWPQNLRRIAVLNGRIDGGVDYSSCQIALKSYTWLTLGKHSPLLTASSGEVKFMPASGTDFCAIFEGKYLLKHSRFRIKTTDQSITNIDVAPGGLFNTQEVIKTGAEGLSALGGGLYTYTFFPVYVPTHSFIPSLSALAITNGLNRNLLENLSNRNLITSGEIPFHTYYAPGTNEAHVSLTPCSAVWVTNEINGINQSPVGIKYEISGPSYFCTSETYSIPNLPAGTTVTWSTTGSIAISGSNNANPVTVTSNSGTGTLTAVLSNACGTATITKSITTGFVINAIQHEAGTNTICASSINNYFSIAEVAGATNYNWTVYPVPASYNIDGNGTPNITFGTNNPGTYALRLAVTTGCGTANANELSLTVLHPTDPNCGFFRSFVIYPNPAGDELTVSIIEEGKQGSLAEGPESEMGSYHLKLYDDKGRVLAAVRSNGKNRETKIDTRDIPNGNYFLHITQGKNIIKKQVIIKH